MIFRDKSDHGQQNDHEDHPARAMKTRAEDVVDLCRRAEFGKIECNLQQSRVLVEGFAFWSSAGVG